MLSKAMGTGTAWHKEYRHGEDLFVDCDEAFLHKDADAGGEGLACTDTELINSLRKIIIDIGKQLGRKLLSGHLNLINISLPVAMFEPRSYLQKLADPWVHPVHLERAAACSNPVERMKLTVTWFVAGLQHVFSSWRKPFNPLLGETWQAELPSGTKIFTEQVSHHPPVTAFHMEGRTGLYTFDGLSQPQVSFSSGGLKTSAWGYRRITFASDGAVVTIKYPYYRIGGLISGVPHGLIKGTATLTDTKFNITATVTFGPVPGAASRLLSRSDSLSVQIQGSAAAAAAVIAVPEWIAAAAAVGEADSGGLCGGVDIPVRSVAAAAAAAAEASLGPERAGCALKIDCMRPEGSTGAAAATTAAQEGEQERRREEQEGNSGQEMHTAAPTTAGPLLHLNSSNRSSSHDAAVLITSRRRSKSSSSIRNSFNWLSKPSQTRSGSSNSSSKKTSRSSSSNSSSRKGAASGKYRLSGPGLGACFGSFNQQDLPKDSDASNNFDASNHSAASSSSRESSPSISRVNSSRSCPEPRPISTPTTPLPELSPAAPAAAAEVEQAVEGPISVSRSMRYETAAAAGACNSPRSRLGASSPGPRSGFHSKQFTEQSSSLTMQNLSVNAAGHTAHHQQQQQCPPGGVNTGLTNTACAPQGVSVAPTGSSLSCNSSCCSRYSDSSSSSSSGSAITALEGPVVVDNIGSNSEELSSSTSCTIGTEPGAAQLQQQQQQQRLKAYVLTNPAPQHQQQQQWSYGSQPQQLLASGTGNWLSHLDFDGQRYLTLADDPPEHWVSLHDLSPQQQQHDLQHQQHHYYGLLQPQQQGMRYNQQQQHQQHHQEGPSCELQLLPSDSQLRSDLVAFRQRDPTAQEMKEHLEHQQRQDAKWRPHFPHIDCAQED